MRMGEMIHTLRMMQIIMMIQIIVMIHSTNEETRLSIDDRGCWGFAHNVYSDVSMISYRSVTACSTHGKS